jgi:hypothetical protein
MKSRAVGIAREGSCGDTIGWRGAIEEVKRLPPPPDVGAELLLEGRDVVLLPPSSSPPPFDGRADRDGARDVALLSLRE